jgi:Tfp pilus assembly protein PilX
MGVPAKHALMLASRAGIALPAALFGLITISLLVAGIATATESNLRRSENREEYARAIMIAEAGASHAVAILRNPAMLRDTAFSRLLRGPANDTLKAGLLVDYGLAAAVQIPAAGRAFGSGLYRVQILDDSSAVEVADGRRYVDVNNRVVIRCTGISRGGSSAVVDVIIGLTPYPAIASNGNLHISGNPAILGQCGSVHANGNLSAGGTTIVAQSFTAAGTASGNNVLYPDGSVVPKESGAPPIDVPNLNYTDFCPGAATYILQSDGWVRRTSDNTLHDARSTARFGWKRASSSPVVWDQDGALATGTFCIQGNAKVGGNPGPVAVSIIATGSVEISGNPRFGAPTHPDGVTIFSGGDLKLNGDSNTLYQGLMYARSQCDISGNPTLQANFLCLNEPNASGTINHFNGNTISGNPNIQYNCDGSLGGGRRIMAWYQRLN